MENPAAARQHILTRADGLSDEAFALIAWATRMATPAELAELAQTPHLLRAAERIIASHDALESAEGRLFRGIIG